MMKQVFAFAAPYAVLTALQGCKSTDPNSHPHPHPHGNHSNHTNPHPDPDPGVAHWNLTDPKGDDWSYCGGAGQVPCDCVGANTTDPDINCASQCFGPHRQVFQESYQQEGKQKVTLPVQCCKKIDGDEYDRN